MRGNSLDELPVEAMAALKLLSKPYSCARDLCLAPWEFSLRLPHLLDLGVGETVLRRLTASGHIEFADDVSAFRDARRQFIPATGLTFTARSCFVLSAKGAAALNGNGAASHLAPPPRKPQILRG